MESAEYQRAWRQRHPGKQQVYNRRYREANRVLINASARERYRSSNGKEKAKEWAKANPDKIKAAKRRYRAKPDTRAKERTADRQWRAQNTLRLLIMHARIRARKHGIPFNLRESDLRLPVTCPVLGMPLTRGVGKLTPASPTLDRIDNGKGYVAGNVMVISYKANTMKNSATFDELRQFIAFYREFLLRVAA